MVVSWWHIYGNIFGILVSAVAICLVLNSPTRYIRGPVLCLVCLVIENLVGRGEYLRYWGDVYCEGVCGVGRVVGVEFALFLPSAGYGRGA